MNICIFFSTGYINRKYLSNTIKKSMGIIMLSLKVWEKIDYRKYMHYKNMDLFQLCHYCLGAYRLGRKCFIPCVTLSSKENALFCVIYFSYFIDNRTLFFSIVSCPLLLMWKNCFNSISITRKLTIENCIWSAMVLD